MLFDHLQTREGGFVGNVDSEVIAPFSTDAPGLSLFEGSTGGLSFVPRITNDGCRDFYPFGVNFACSEHGKLYRNPQEQQWGKYDDGKKFNRNNSTLLELG